MTLLWILLATTSMSAIALLGSLALSVFPSVLKKVSLFLVALAAGTMLSAGLLDLLPEATNFLPLQTVLWILLGTFAVLLGAEKVLHWHHGHESHGDECHNKPLGYMNLLGDGVHNFLDGVVIAAAFQVSIPVGIATTIAVAAHELPQEIGDFGVLIHAGFTRTQALLANVGASMLAILGGLIGFWLTQTSSEITAYLLPIAAGSFLYLAAVDLIPEFREEDDRRKSALLFGCFLFGLIALPLFTRSLGLEHSHEHHEHVEEHLHTEHDEHDEEHEHHGE